MSAVGLPLRSATCYTLKQSSKTGLTIHYFNKIMKNEIENRGYAQPSDRPRKIGLSYVSPFIGSMMLALALSGCVKDAGDIPSLSANVAARHYDIGSPIQVFVQGVGHGLTAGNSANLITKAMAETSKDAFLPALPESPKGVSYLLWTLTPVDLPRRRMNLFAGLYVGGKLARYSWGSAYVSEDTAQHDLVREASFLTRRLCTNEDISKSGLPSGEWLCGSDGTTQLLQKGVL